MFYMRIYFIQYWCSPSRYDYMRCVARFNKACNFTKINTPPWVFFAIFKLYKCYQIAQRTTYEIFSPFMAHLGGLAMWTSSPTLHKKWSFLLRISSLNVTKSAASYGFGHINKKILNGKLCILWSARWASLDSYNSKWGNYLILVRSRSEPILSYNRPLHVMHIGRNICFWGM